MSRNYYTFMLAEEPKIAGIPLVTGLPVFSLTAIGLITGMSYQLFLIGSALSVLLHLKFGRQPIRVLFAFAYWSLPRVLTAWFFRAWPDSANRIYIR